MSHRIRTSFTFLLLLFLGNSSGNYAAQSKQKPSEAGTGTFEKLIVQSGSVTMQLDVDRLNGASSAVAAGVSPAKPSHLRPAPLPLELHFAAAPDSFFTIRVLNGQLRGPQPSSMGLIAEAQPVDILPAELVGSLKQLVIEKLSPDAPFDLAVRNGKTGFTFFYIEGHQYNYDAHAQLLNIAGGRLIVSKELGKALGRPLHDSGIVGKISIRAAMEPIEVRNVLNGEIQSVVMPPLRGRANAETPTLVPGPDVIVGDLPEMAQYGTDGNFVGLGIGTTSCNNGDQPLHWFALPQTDHPVIPQNFYRMSGGVNNNDRFEQIGQSWLKHAFEALEGDSCSFGCNTNGCTTGSNLCPGCSDPYGSGLNADQNGIGSRAWVNPFTGVFPSGANNHSGHNHTGTSHRITVATSDLDPSLNPAATYFAEAQYVTPHEYSWCQAHSGECNMYNNISYRRFNVTGGPTNFTFSPAASTVRMQPAIMGWTNAAVNQVEPDPGNDGIWFMGYKVTNPGAGVWHYEYALYNENLDRAIQSFTVPLGPGVNITNIGFHAPPQEPGWANDGTFNNQGYNGTPWDVTQDASSITWRTETFLQNQNANAIRFGTLYNFRFDADQPPNLTDATVGFFKTGGPMPVLIEAPGTVPTPSPTPTPTASPTPTCGLNTIQTGGSIVPGVTDTGNHGDDQVTNIPLPFAYNACGGTYNSINVSSNGNAQFNTNDTSFTNVCLPWSGHDCTIFPYWDDLRTDANSGCSSYPGGTCGVYTSVSGTAPNRIFNIEWRAVYYGSPGDTANFEIRLYEGQNRFDVIYGPIAAGNTSATAGIQSSDTCFAEYFCNGVGGPATGGWTLSPAATPTPTATATLTPTATVTPTATTTATATATATFTPIPTASATATPISTATPTPTATPRPTPTPRSSPAPRPRPTPGPRP